MKILRVPDVKMKISRPQFPACFIISNHSINGKKPAGRKQEKNLPVFKPGHRKIPRQKKRGFHPVSISKLSATVYFML